APALTPSSVRAPVRAPVAAGAAVCAVLVVLAGCSGSEDDGGTAPPARSPGAAGASSGPAAGPGGPDGAPGCRPASPVARYGGDGRPEVRATGRGIRARGLLMSPKGWPPLRADQELKIVWRVTGEGPLRAAATGPDGRDRPITWGPESHGGSSFQRPGQEWG